ncbi:DUF5723 family protein [Spirosoma soli]|uniref:DUF5723 family protein n=1 Tax=Spirosoma soli TaxID=1770529 RepID=A0ABW5LX38_9BACT
MKYLLLLGSLALVTTASFAQNLLGISTSRYGGTNRLYINPSLAADSPSKVYFNIFTANLHANNNYVRYQAPFSLISLISGTVPDRYRSPDGAVNFAVEYTRENLDGKPKNGTISGEVRGPALLMRTGERGAFAITSRLRAVGQVLGASQALLSAVRSGLSDGAIFGLPTTNNQFSANTNTYAELGFTYAGTVWEDDGRKLLLGATVKGLLGYNAQHFINKGLGYRIDVDEDNPNAAYLEVTRLNASLAYTTFLQNRTLTPRTLLSTSIPGLGAGFDFGFTYISQYDADSPALQLGIAMTDIGGLTYKGPEYDFTNIEQNQAPVRFVSSDFNNVGGSVGIARVIQEKLSAGRTPDRNRFQAGLPTSLNLTLDYQLPDGLGLNVTYLQDVRAQEATAVHQPTLFAVTPRYDTRWVSIAVPVAYLNRGLTAGASLRVGPAWLGTDNFLGLIGNTSNGIQPRGLDIYAGFAFGLGRANSYDE